MSFICDRCGKSFSTKQRLLTHTSKKIKCILNNSINDAKTTVNVITQNDSNGLIITHKLLTNYSQPTKILSCKYCGKEFTRKWNLIRHHKHCNNLSSNKRRQVIYENSESDNELSETSSEDIIQPKSTSDQPKSTSDQPKSTSDNNIIDIKKERIFICEYCGNLFKENWIKERHIKYRCKKREDIIMQQQKTIGELHSKLEEKDKKINKREKKIERKNEKLKKVYTEKEVLGKAVNNYNFVFEACKNSRDLRCPTIQYEPPLQTIKYKQPLQMIEYKNNYEVIDGGDEIDTDNDTENDNRSENEDDLKNGENDIKQEDIVENGEKENSPIKFVKDQVEFYINLGARNGITAMIKKLIVDNIKITDRGAWCIDPNRSNFIIKSNGMMFQDRNGQDLLSIIMPGIEKIFFDDLNYWSNKLQAEGYIKSTGTIENLYKRQTFVREMRDKVVRKCIAHDIGAPLYADRKKIIEQLKQENFENINIIFEDTPIETHHIVEID